MPAFTCPHCNQLLEVPAVLPTTDATGNAGSLTQAPAAPTSPASVEELLSRRTGQGSRYQVAQEIARGGMGTVLRAVDCDLHREVAIKYMLDQTDLRRVLRFVEEAQITGQLEHPNIVPIHELAVDNRQRLFFSMKMVKGRSLAQVFKELHNPASGVASAPRAEQEWPLSRLLTILVGVCNALAYAHSRGVIHRDVKPANVMVGDFGEVYLMDWGLAKVLSVGQASRLPADPGKRDACPPAPVVTSRDDARLTQDGAMIGTPAYMPPEQAGGDPNTIGPRSDVYALGALLYEMLTLQPPVEDEHGPMAAVVQVIQGLITPPEQRTPDRARAGKIPRELSAIAMKALAKRPEDRYPTVEALRRDIELFQEGRSVSAKEGSKRELLVKFVKRNKALSAAAALLALVLAASSWLNYQARLDVEAALAKYQKAEEDRRLEKKRRQRVQ